MFGSSFPVWAIVLIASVIVIVILASVNPHFSKGDKAKMRQYAATNYAHAPPEISVRYFFNESVFFAVGLLSSGIALILFFVQDYKKAVEYYGGSGWGKALIIIFAVGAAILLPTTLAMIGFTAEKSQVLALRSSVKRRYHITITPDDDELF